MEYFRDGEELSFTNIVRYQKIKTEYHLQKSRLKQDVLEYFLRKHNIVLETKKIGNKLRCKFTLATGVTVVGSPNRLIFYFLWNR